MLNEKYLKKAVDKYSDKCLVINMLSKRVEQLNRGSRPLVEEESKEKVNIALKEIIEEKVTVDEFDKFMKDQGK